jgi:hypothetical protein
MENETLENLIFSIEKEIDSIRKTPKQTKELPSNLKILLSGVSSSNGINFLFSQNIDVLLEKLFDLFNSGKIEELLLNEDKLKEIFEKIGIGEGSFEGEISKAVINSIQTSIQSEKYLKTKTKIQKALIVLKALKQKAKSFQGKERKKYEDALYACKRLLQIVYKIYKNRKLVNERLLKGLNNIIREDDETETKLEKIE